MSCIVSGFLQQLFSSLIYMPILCMFVGFMALICYTIQLVFMGYYQLCRLYYCFANSQIHSNKGYPKWLFIIMYAYGTVGCVLYIIFYFLDNTCRINDKFFFYSTPIHISISSYAVTMVVLVISVGYLMWDIGTLVLYVSKIRAFRRFKNSDPVIYTQKYVHFV